MLRKLSCSLLIISFLMGCSTQPEETSTATSKKAESNRTLPGSNGGRLDIIVIAKNSIWLSKPGKEIRKYFTEAQYGLPQPESKFTLRQVTPREFNSLLKRTRNLIILEEAEQASYSLKPRVWAKPQLVATFTGQNEDELVAQIKAHQKELMKELYDQEANILQRRVTKNPQPLPNILKQHRVSMRIPPAYEVEIEQDNLLVLWNKTVNTDQGIIIHFRPLDSNETMLGKDIISTRDSLTQLHIPGSLKGSYMITETIIAPRITPTEMDGNFAFETRGLWKTVGEFKGGPFISYTIFDEAHQQEITLDAFIYAPEINKRNLLFELESILRTFELEG